MILVLLSMKSYFELYKKIWHIHIKLKISHLTSVNLYWQINSFLQFLQSIPMRIDPILKICTLWFFSPPSTFILINIFYDLTVQNFTCWNCTLTNNRASIDFSQHTTIMEISIYSPLIPFLDYYFNLKLSQFPSYRIFRSGCGHSSIRY